jgi:hypothetical protein
MQLASSGSEHYCEERAELLWRCLLFCQQAAADGEDKEEEEEEEEGPPSDYDEEGTLVATLQSFYDLRRISAGREEPTAAPGQHSTACMPCLHASFGSPAWLHSASRQRVLLSLKGMQCICVCRTCTRGVYGA